MKVKLKNRQELQAVYLVVANMATKLAEEATRPTKPNEREHVRMACRLVALELHKQALNIAMKLAMPSDTYTIRINAHGGLALLSAWYAVDVTEINDPLAYAVMSEIMDNLQKAYGSQTITQP
jgi:hypothetical protein